MSFYHLPHPWDPGYAIPKYVMAEPPERGTFTTQWLPRGTIPVLVPDYLAKPGKQLLGRDDADLGSLGGSTLRGNSLAGTSLAGTSLSNDTLGAREYTLEPLGQTEMASYGKRVATTLIGKIKTLPSHQRPAAMRRAMDAIDPTLHARAEKIANAARSKGVPAPAALHHGIATAMTQGLVAELAQTGRGRNGRSRTSRQPGPLHGLAGMRAHRALGADPIIFSGAAGLQVQPILSFASPPTATPAPGPAPGKMITVGPWQFEDKQGATRFVGWAEVPSVNAAWKAKAIQRLGMLTSGSSPVGFMWSGGPSPKAQEVLPRVFGPGTYGGYTPLRMLGGDVPLFSFDHPSWGRAGLWLKSEGNDQYPGFSLRIDKFPESLVAKFLDPYFKLNALVFDVSKDAVKAVQDLTCSVLAMPGAAQGAAAANPTAGAGVALAMQMCSSPPPSYPMPLPSGGSMLLPLVLVGGGLALVYVLTQ